MHGFKNATSNVQNAEYRYKKAFLHRNDENYKSVGFFKLKNCSILNEDLKNIKPDDVPLHRPNATSTHIIKRHIFLS